MSGSKRGGRRKSESNFSSAVIYIFKGPAEHFTGKILKLFSLSYFFRDMEKGLRDSDFSESKKKDSGEGRLELKGES